MTKTLTVEGDLTAADTLTDLTTQGSVTAPSKVTPAGVSKIDRIIAAAAHDGAAAGSGAYLLRLGGSAVMRGEQCICIGAGGAVAIQAGADGSHCFPVYVELDDVDIEVSPSETLKISAEMAGNDLGTARVAVTLVFA